MEYRLGEFALGFDPIRLFASMSRAERRPEVRDLVRRHRERAHAADLLEESRLPDDDRRWLAALHDQLSPRRGFVELEGLEFDPESGAIALTMTDRSLSRDVRAGDDVVAGFAAARSPEGELRMWPRLYRLMCANGAILFIGTGRGEAVEAWNVASRVEGLLGDRPFEAATGLLVQAARSPLDDPLRMLARARARTPADVVARAWPRTDDHTVYGLVNVVTAHARGEPDAARRFDLEKDAGRILQAVASPVGAPEEALVTG